MSLEVIKVAPPGAEPVKVSVGAASSDAEPLADLYDGDAKTIWITVTSDVPCHLHFGDADMDAATNAHMRLPADAWIPMEINLDLEGHVRVIRAGSDSGSLWVYRSSR